MHRLIIEVDRRLYLRLERAAQSHHLSVEAECLRRLEDGEQHSCYLQALLAELRADEEQRRANDNDRVA